MPRQKICVATGSRADYGLLFWVMREIQNDPDLELQVVVTGMHLSPEFGLTYKTIESDGFTIHAKIETLLSSDTTIGMAKSIGLGILGFADAFGELTPDFVIVLGDRYEIFAATQAAYMQKIAIAHIAGGDITEGSLDDAMRHCISKMSHLHFATNETAAGRIRQLGENPENVFNVGSPGIDYIRHVELLKASALEAQLNFKFKERNFLITFHPATLGKQPATVEFQALLDALDTVSDKDTMLLFTQTNSDAGGRALMSMLNGYISTRENHVRVFTSLGQVRYISLMAHVDVVIGNSSSGLYEAPTLRKPTVNIGDRQKGRPQADSVVNCHATPQEIAEAIRIALTKDCSDTINPYGEGDSSKTIVAILKNIANPKDLLKKRFFDVA